MRDAIDSTADRRPTQGISSLTGTNIVLQNEWAKCLMNRAMCLAGEERHPRTEGVEGIQTEDMRRPLRTNRKEPPASQAGDNRTQAGWIDGPRGWAKHKQVLAHSLVAAITLEYLLNGCHRSLSPNRCTWQSTGFVPERYNLPVIIICGDRVVGNSKTRKTGRNKIEDRSKELMRELVLWLVWSLGGPRCDLADYDYNFTRSCWFSDYSDYIFRTS